MKNDFYSDCYEADRSKIWMPGVPIIDGTGYLTDRKRVAVAGVTTLKTSVEMALSLTDEVLKTRNSGD